MGYYETDFFRNGSDGDSESGISVVSKALKTIISAIVAVIIALHAIFLSLSVLAAFLLMVFFVVYQAML